MSSPCQVSLPLFRTKSSSSYIFSFTQMTFHEKSYKPSTANLSTAPSSRLPKKIQESLTKAKLYPTPGKPENKYYSGELVNH
ncbi:hypothetical protein ACHAWF_014661 [Thalassiosira exigua]